MNQSTHRSVGTVSRTHLQADEQRRRDLVRFVERTAGVRPERQQHEVQSEQRYLRSRKTQQRSVAAEPKDRERESWFTHQYHGGAQRFLEGERRQLSGARMQFVAENPHHVNEKYCGIE